MIREYCCKNSVYLVFPFSVLLIFKKFLRKRLTKKRTHQDFPQILKFVRIWIYVELYLLLLKFYRYCNLLEIYWIFIGIVKWQNASFVAIFVVSGGFKDIRLGLSRQQDELEADFRQLSF